MVNLVSVLLGFLYFLNMVSPPRVTVDEYLSKKPAAVKAAKENAEAEDRAAKAAREDAKEKQKAEDRAEDRAAKAAAQDRAFQNRREMNEVRQNGLNYRQEQAFNNSLAIANARNGNNKRKASDDPAGAPPPAKAARSAVPIVPAQYPSAKASDNGAGAVRVSKRQKDGAGARAPALHPKVQASFGKAPKK